MAGRAPALLEHYLALPPETALIVLSGVIGASTNWLVLRYLSSLLGRPLPAAAVDLGAGHRSEEGPQPPEHAAVLLVSFLRDYAFWRDSAARLGVDLELWRRKGRFSFVDGLTGLFTPPHSSPTNGGASGPFPSRTLAWGPQGVRGVTATLLDAVVELRGGQGDGPSPKLVLVVDQPDLLLAAAGAEATVADLRDMLLDLREQVHATVVTLSADEPLVSAQQTTLEREHASLALSLAHEADMLLSLRLLDTGTANDVSGMVRITRGGGGSDGVNVEEHEYLYHIGGDGGIRVFERGQ